MLFYLTDSLIVDDKDSEEFKRVYNACRNLTESSYNSRHLVLGDLNLLEWLKDIFGEYDPVKGIIIGLINDYSFSTIPNGITEYVEVVRNIPENNRLENGRTIYQLDFSRFQDSCSLSKSILIGEDLNDAKMFFEIGRWYNITNNLSLHLSYEPRAGAGGIISRVVTQHQQEHKIFACIVDTDQRYPGGPYGSTCSGCLHLTFSAPLEEFKKIDAHEVENIFPKNLIKSLGYMPGSLKHFESIYENLDPQEDIRYFDMKSGFSKHKKFSDDSLWVAYYERCYNANCHVNTRPFHPRFENAATGDTFFPGIDAKILDNTLNWMQSNSPAYINFDFLPFQQAEWESIGKIIINKCICRNNEALNF